MNTENEELYSPKIKGLLRVIRNDSNAFLSSFLVKI